MTLLDRLLDRRAYLDANVFIYAVEEVAPWFRIVRPVIEGLGTGAVAAVTSAITLAEVLVRPLRDGDERAQRAFARTVCTHGGLVVVPVSRAVLVEAARLRAASPLLKLPDAIHAATARLHGCAVLLTNDVRLRAAPGIEVVQLSDVV